MMKTKAEAFFFFLRAYMRCIKQRAIVFFFSGCVSAGSIYGFAAITVVTFADRPSSSERDKRGR